MDTTYSRIARHRTRHLTIAALTITMIGTTIGTTACGDLSGLSVAATTLVAATTVAQSASVGTTATLAVEVLDQNHTPMSGVTVSWVIASGTGALSSATATSDVGGTAMVRYIPADAGSTAVVTAGVTGLNAVDFTIAVAASSIASSIASNVASRTASS